MRRAGLSEEEAAAQAEKDKQQQRIDAANKAKEQLAKGFNSLFNKPKPKPKPVEPEPTPTPADTAKKGN